jgi:hypothetical protein
LGDVHFTMPRNTKRVREEDVDRKVVFMVRDKRFIVLRNKLQVQPPACTVCMNWLV